MVSAELTYNPYLLITKVKFNGQSPRINSQIEKYEKQPLKDWVHMVPIIFYNEMNGYDFDFYFVGTKPDFEEIKAAFISAGVTDDQVRLFHKNEIEDAETKSEEIDRLIEWMRNHPNRKFDFQEFWENKKELFEGSYPFIIINGNAPAEIGPSISPESIKNIQELQFTDLTSTPILFIITEKTAKQFRQDLVTILKRKDICQEQLFFMIDPQMNKSRVIRVISDLGVNDPIVIERYDDEAVIAYIKNYPITEYVRSAISVFSSIVNEIGAILQQENKESEETNAEVHLEIDSLDDDLRRLKKADDYFVQRDNYEICKAFTELRIELEDYLSNWKNKKIKVIGDSSGGAHANEYSLYTKKAVATFVDSMRNSYKEAGSKIEEDYSTAYKKAGIDLDFKPENVLLGDCGSITIPDLNSTLLGLEEVTFEHSRSDFFGFLRNPFEENGEPVQIVTYYLEQWREKVKEIVIPQADKLITGCSKALVEYYNSLADCYHKHLEELIQNKTKEKEIVAARLTDDERKLQEDNDWLSEIENQLQNIERG